MSSSSSSSPSSFDEYDNNNLFSMMIITNINNSSSSSSLTSSSSMKNKTFAPPNFINSRHSFQNPKHYQHQLSNRLLPPTVLIDEKSNKRYNEFLVESALNNNKNNSVGNFFFPEYSQKCIVAFANNNNNNQDKTEETMLNNTTTSSSKTISSSKTTTTTTSRRRTRDGVTKQKDDDVDDDDNDNNEDDDNVPFLLSMMKNNPSTSSNNNSSQPTEKLTRAAKIQARKEKEKAEHEKMDKIIEEYSTHHVFTSSSSSSSKQPLEHNIQKAIIEACAMFAHHSSSSSTMKTTKKSSSSFSTNFRPLFHHQQQQSSSSSSRSKRMLSQSNLLAQKSNPSLVPFNLAVSKFLFWENNNKNDRSKILITNTFTYQKLEGINRFLLPSSNINNSSNKSSSSSSSLLTSSLSDKFKETAKNQFDFNICFDRITINPFEEERRNKEKKYARNFEKTWKIQEQETAQRRLAALKSNNPEEYFRHLRDAKWSSILQIMEMTHNLMLKIGAKLETKQEDKKLTLTSSSSAKVEVDREPVVVHKNYDDENNNSEEKKCNSNNSSSSSSGTTTTVAAVDDSYRRFQEYVRSSSDEYKLIHKNDVFVAEQPKALQASLYPHQLVGLRFLASLHGNGINGVLADDMGVGKTLQTLSFMTYLKESKLRKGMHLVLAPLSIIREWQDSVATFIPSLRVHHINSDADFSSIAYSTKDVDLCLIALHRVRFFTASSLLFRHKWHYVVVDEAHKAVSNPDTAMARAIKQIPFYNRLVLTGTPLNSDVQELWSLLQFINPDIFSSGDDTQATFDEVFRKPFANIGLKNPQQAAELRLAPEERDLIVMRLHQILKPFVLRRTKLDIDTSLRITFHNIWCPLSALQIRLLNLLRGKINNFNNNKQENSDENQFYSSSSVKNKKGVLPAIFPDGSAQYQRGNSLTSNALSICNHPFMCDFLPQLLRRDNIPENEEEEIVLRSSGKLCVLDAIIVHLHKQNRKVVVFSHFLDTIDILQNHFISRGWGEQFVSLTGAASPEQRAQGVRRFRDDPDTFIFLLSMKAGGCGLNLQIADTIVLYDRDYTATNEDQAIARVFRMGQKNVVRAIYLMTKDETEQRVATIAEIKDKPRKEIIEGGSYLVKTDDGDKNKNKNVDDDEEEEDEDTSSSDDDDNNEEDDDTNNSKNKTSSGLTKDDKEKEEKDKKLEEERQKIEDIHCDGNVDDDENSSSLESVLVQKVFNGFLSRTVARDEGVLDEDDDDKKTNPTKIIDNEDAAEKQEESSSSSQQNNNNNEENGEENKNHKIDETMIHQVIPPDDDEDDQDDIPPKQQDSSSSPQKNSISTSTSNATTDNDNDNNNDKNTNTSVDPDDALSTTLVHQCRATSTSSSSSSSAPPLLPSLVNAKSIITPYQHSSEFHPSLRKVFEECEKNEIEGADGDLGIGCRKNNNLLLSFDDDSDDSSDDSDDDDDENRTKKKNKKKEFSTNPELLHLFLDDHIDLEAVNKIMNEGDLDDEDEAIEIWRNRLIEKYKKTKEIEAENLRLSLENGEPIVDFEKSFEDMNFTFYRICHRKKEGKKMEFSSFSSKFKKQLKEKLKLKQVVIKTKTQYKNEFVDEMKSTLHHQYHHHQHHHAESK